MERVSHKGGDAPVVGSVEDFPNGSHEVGQRSSLLSTETRLQKREELLNRVQLGVVGWNEHKSRSSTTHGFADGLHVMEANVVEDNDVARPQRRAQFRFDELEESLAVDGPVEGLPRRDSITAHGCKYRDVASTRERDDVDGALAATRPGSTWCHREVHTALVEVDDLLENPLRDLVDEFAPPLLDLGLEAAAGSKGLFFSVRPARSTTRLIVEIETRSPVRSNQRSQMSCSVASLFVSTITRMTPSFSGDPRRFPACRTLWLKAPRLTQAPQDALHRRASDHEVRGGFLDGGASTPKEFPDAAAKVSGDGFHAASRSSSCAGVDRRINRTAMRCMPVAADAAAAQGRRGDGHLG